MLQLIRNNVKSSSKEEKGATMVEYAIVLGLIGLVAAAGATTLGTNLNTWFGNLAKAIGALASTT